MNIDGWMFGLVEKKRRGFTVFVNIARSVQYVLVCGHKVIEKC